ncbi:MAG: endo-1,4-beta-xylanase [Kiritimatiellae bacterium]|nr:endo-1,4-beta-xylanase [Kiritimatiellia bacterium]
MKAFRIGIPALAALCAATSFGAFTVDKSAMSDEYWKIWNDGVQAKIDAKIEKFRKADGSFAVAAPDGAEVKVEQISHAFFFGAHIFNYNQLGKKEWNDRYKELYGALFNSATVAFYWRTLEPYPHAPRFAESWKETEEFWNNCAHPKDEPHWRRPAPDPVIDFLKTRGCRIHGHPLVWGNVAWHRPTWIWDDFCPDAEKFALERKTGVKIPVNNWRLPMGVKDMADNERGWSEAWKKVFDLLSEEEIAATVPTFVKAYNDFYEKRIKDIAERYGSRVDSWDVVNESATDYHDWQGEKAVRGTPCQKSWYGLMPGDYCFKGFQWACKYLPKTAWLNLNDYNMAPFFFKQAKDLESNGVRVDVVGSQMHLFNPAESVNIKLGKGPEHLRPENVDARFDLLSKAGKPIHLSEITITAPDNSPQGQMVQAIIMRNLYRAWFSQEKMNGITWWNVVDDCGAPGEPSISGLFTRDMRPKTCYFAMDDLINREWKTKTTVKAAGGKASFRGFRGRYRLSWKDAAGKERSQLVELK